MNSINLRLHGLKICLGVIFFTLALRVHGQNPVINSFSGNGQLTCTNLAAGSVAAVEWAASPNGPWQTNWAALEAVTVNSNGVIAVSVPMFYRVRGVMPVTTTNHAPIAVDDFEAGEANTDLVRATSVFLANDLDPDGQTLTITAVSGAVNGTVVLVGATITFTPSPGFTGIASFNYTVSDGTLTDTGNAVILVVGN